MDKKQFELFQEAVQWVLDEKRASEKGRKHNRIWHKQKFWGQGEVTDESVTQVGTSLTMSVVCPSAACLAGNVVLLHGDRMVALVNHGRPGDVVQADYCADDKDRVYMIGTRARQLLGITSEEAAIFGGDHSRRLVIEMAKEIAENHGYKMELI